MGHVCDSCCHWRSDSMWKGSPCYIGFEPETCSEPWQICPFCKESFTDDKCLSAALARITTLEEQLTSAHSSGAREFGEALIACGNEGSTDEWFRTFVRKQLARFLSQKKAVG